VVVLLLELTRSSAAPAAYMLARVVPRLAGAAVGGELADRLRPQRVAALQGALMASIIPAAQHRLVWPIYVAVALSQLLGAVGRPSLMALVPRLVAEGGLIRANALVSAAVSSSVVVAPALSVPLLQIFHSPLALIGIDVASFAVSALLLASLRDGHLRALAGAYLGGAAAVTTASAVLVIAAADRFGGDDRVGALYAAVGVGSVLASGFALMRRSTHVLRSSLIAGGLAEIVLLSVLTICPNLVTAVVVLAASGAAGILYEVWGASELQRRAASEVLGRASAAVVAAQYAGMLLGAVAAAVLVPLMGWDHALFAVCCVSVVVVAASATGPVVERAPAPVDRFVPRGSRPR
jgi:hypothetical protein